MNIKYNLLGALAALSVVCVYVFIIDVDIQSWIPTISFQSKLSTDPDSSKINSTPAVRYTVTEGSRYQDYQHAHRKTSMTPSLTSLHALKQPLSAVPTTLLTTRQTTLLQTGPSTSLSHTAPDNSRTKLSSATLKIVRSSSTLLQATTSGVSAKLQLTPKAITPATIKSTSSNKLVESTTTSTLQNASLKSNVVNEIKVNYILNLPGCKIKYYKPFDEEVKRYYSNKTDLKCGSSFAFANGTELRIDKATMIKVLRLNETDVTCKLFEILRKDEGKTDKKYSKTFVQNISTEIYNVTQEFLEVTCFQNGTVVYDDLFAFIQPKEKVELRCENVTKLMKGNDKRKTKFNVVFVGLDSVSHRNFLRHFPKTYNELKENFDLLEYNGYTKVGLNTFPCLLPLFTGKSEDELNPGKGPYDNIPFIWKKFSSIGYRTLFGEDWPGIAIFHYLKKGFYYSPMDYYLRPFYLAVQNSKMRKLSKGRCFNSRIELSVPLKWCQEFLTVFSDKPVFSFSFMSHLTHDALNDAGYGDTPMYEFVHWFKNTTVRNNTFLILLSDHGIRWGGFRKTAMGAQEDNLPFLFLMAPPWFHEVYPHFYKNLKLNQDRLMTLFDVHEMLKDILNFTGDPRNVKPTFHQRGISLFDEIPIERTCDDAGIGEEYCSCHIRKQISVNSSFCIRAAKTLVEAINNKTESKRAKCDPLVLHNVTSARVYTINKRFPQNELKTLDSVKLRLYTVPGSGLFEGVVWCEYNATEECTVHGDIDRINKYGNQSICINDSVMKNYCYCSDTMQNTTANP